MNDLSLFFKLAKILGFILLLFNCSTLQWSGEFQSQSEFQENPDLYPTDDETHQINEDNNSIVQKNSSINFKWPTKNARLTQNFRPTKNPSHDGIDLAGRKNSPIYASHDGVVVYAGRGFKGYGKMVILAYDDTWATLYAHLNIINVKTGSKVKSQQLIGKMGRTGRASGVHLHFEVMKNKQPIDPLSFLENNSRMVTLSH